MEWVSQLKVGGCLVFPMVMQTVDRSKKVHISDFQKLHRIIREDNQNKISIDCVLDTEVRFDMME